MAIEDTLALNVSLINLAIKCYIEQIEYVDKALEYCVDMLAKKDISL